jgi:hypothetical protein
VVKGESSLGSLALNTTAGHVTFNLLGASAVEVEPQPGSVAAKFWQVRLGEEEDGILTFTELSR